MSQMSQVFREHALGRLTARMSTRAVAREFNVYSSTISRHRHLFGEFGSMFNCRPPAQDLHIWILHLWDRLRPSTRTTDETVGTIEFLHKLSETVSGKLICVLTVLTRVLICSAS
jgi:hypothetical protein